MKVKEIYDDLYDYCRWNQPEKVQKILKNNPYILDITYDNGLLIHFAIKYNNINMMKDILSYFEEKQLLIKSCNVESQESKDKLMEILENATENIDLSSEMKQVLTPYVDFEGSEHDILNDSFLDDYKVAFSEMLEKDNFNENFLTEDNLRKLEAIEKNNQIKSFEDLFGANSSLELTHNQLDHHEDPNTELNLIGKINEVH